MLDQNTTTIITSALTVIGTLGGVVLGVVLSNRYVARQDKAKRNAAIIEEVYILLTNIHSEITQNIEFNNPTLQGKQLQDDMGRVQALVYLYLPSLREKFDIFMKALSGLSGWVHAEQEDGNPPEVVWRNIGEPYKKYQAKLNGVITALGLACWCGTIHLWVQVQSRQIRLWASTLSWMLTNCTAISGVQYARPARCMCGASTHSVGGWVGIMPVVHAPAIGHGPRVKTIIAQIVRQDN